MVQIPNAPRTGDLPQGGKPIPEGVYHLRCDKALYKLSKENKTPMVEATWTVFGPADAEEFHGRKVFDNLMLAGDGAFRIRQVLEATGHDEDFVLDDTDQLLTLEVAAVVQEEKEREEPNPADPAHPKKYAARNKIARYTAIE